MLLCHIQPSQYCNWFFYFHCVTGMHSDSCLLHTAADHWSRVWCFLLTANISLLIFVIVAAANRAWRDILKVPFETSTWLQIKSGCFSCLQIQNFFTWYPVGILQSVKWLAMGWMLSMQFLLEAVIFLVVSGLTALQPTKPPVELILWRLFTGKKCLILCRLLAFV